MKNFQGDKQIRNEQIGKAKENPDLAKWTTHKVDEYLLCKHLLQGCLKVKITVENNKEPKIACNLKVMKQFECRLSQFQSTLRHRKNSVVFLNIPNFYFGLTYHKTICWTFQ